MMIRNDFKMIDRYKNYNIILIIVILLIAIILFLQANVQQANAQQLNNRLQASGDIEIEADDGIEWAKNDAAKTGEYHASGNVIAKRGDLTINTDDLTAYYRSNSNGKKQDIFRMDAVGHVKINTNDTMVVGDKAVYYIDKRLAVVIGNNLKLKSPNITITADQSLEYWQTKNIAVAKGNATVIQNGTYLRAGIITAFIGFDKKTSKYNIKRIDATGGVHISSATEIIQAQQAVYNLTKQIITICGDVKITRGQSQLNGECAEVNMKTGHSKIKGGRSKVKGLIIPLQ